MAATALLAPTFAAAATSPPATPGPSAPAPAVLRATLDNGLRVVVVPDPLAPVVTTEVNYLVGSNEAPAGFPGMAHAQEHMMFRGSPGLSADQLAAISAAMGGEFDADTQQTVTQYFFTVPSEDLDVALHIEALRMRGVLDSESLWEKERGAIEQEVARDLSSPEYVMYTDLLAALFKGTPYAHDALGTRPSFDATTGAMLAKFHKAWYVPNNAILVIAGDVEPEAALAKVKALFGEIPAAKLPPRPELHLEPVKPRQLALTTDLPYGLVVTTFRTPGYGDPDLAAAEVLADVLNSQRGSLYALVPAGKALDTGFSLNALPGTGLGFAVAAFPRGADAKALLAEMQGVLAADRAQGVPADLVAAAKRRELASLEFARNSIAGLADSWSDAVAVQGLSSPAEGVAAIQRVTVADVNRVAKRILDPAHAVTAVLTPQPSGKPVAAKGFGGKESFTPSNPKPVPLPEWASAALGRLAVPQSAVAPVVSTLPNGLRLIVQPEAVSNTVTLVGAVHTNPDLETPAGQEGVDQVLESLFSWGSTSLDRLAFQKALDDIAANESAGTSFSLQVLADHFERGVELLADNELHPALPPQAFKVVQAQTAAALAGQLESPDYLAGRALDRLLYPPHDPTLREATPASVSGLTLDDVKAYYEKVFRPDLTTIVVIGKITPQRAAAAVTKAFGAWKANGLPPETLLPQIPPNPAGSTLVPDSSRVQDRVTLAETLALTRFDPDAPALALGNHVLGGAFYATRLYRDLREEAGLVYTVSSSLDLGRTRSLYVVSYACDPPNVAKARTIVQRDLEQMRRQPVGEDELRQAKALMLREIPLSEASLDAIAGGLLERSLHAEPLDQPTRTAHRILGLTGEQVQAAFARWLHPDDLVQVTQGPSPPAGP